LQGYIDTANLNYGEYDVNISLYYETLNKQYMKKLSIIKEPVVVPKKESFNWKKTLTTKNLLIAMSVTFAILIIVILATMIPWRKKGKKEESKPSQPASTAPPK
jgi:hypothetical protein